MMILPVRAPPEKIFPGRIAQLVDHPYKCRSALLPGELLADSCSLVLSVGRCRYRSENQPPQLMSKLPQSGPIGGMTGTSDGIRTNRPLASRRPWGGSFRGR
jgi:hypothetical protein